MPVWKRISPPYPVFILGYHADKKYHGVKKFTSYEIKANVIIFFNIEKKSVSEIYFN